MTRAALCLPSMTLRNTAELPKQVGSLSRQGALRGDSLLETNWPPNCGFYIHTPAGGYLGNICSAHVTDGSSRSLRRIWGHKNETHNDLIW